MPLLTSSTSEIVVAITPSMRCRYLRLDSVHRHLCNQSDKISFILLYFVSNLDGRRRGSQNDKAITAQGQPWPLPVKASTSGKGETVVTPSTAAQVRNKIQKNKAYLIRLVARMAVNGVRSRTTATHGGSDDDNYLADRRC
ncbi:hypothetical protein V6N13_001171 [Hibiscus sabdariffa]|uniref:Uncharacterized protein n=1 Tax=Hibiscus sabdariffa TaxID=183260 RepID=A0ABR2G8K4_9ROSI